MLNVTVVDEAYMADPFALEAPSTCKILVAAPRHLRLHGAVAPDRAPVERFIEQTYARAFGGRIRHHFPQLMSLQDETSRICAAAGFRLASDGPLFLEQYLDAPVEQVIGAGFGRVTERRAIAEIGSFACRAPGSSIILFAGLARHLSHLGCTVAAATTTALLRRTFARTGFAVEVLAPARADRLNGGAEDWGAYYAHEPQVVAGRVGPCLEALTFALSRGLRPPRLGSLQSAEARA